MSSKEAFVDPHKVRQQQVATWMQCCETVPLLKRCVNKDVAKKIGDMVPVDLRSLPIVATQKGYCYSDPDPDGTGNNEPPCMICFLPSSFFWVDLQHRLWQICVKRHETVVLSNAYTSSTKLCDCDRTVTCFDCADKLARQNNWILPPKTEDVRSNKRHKPA